MGKATTLKAVIAELALLVAIGLLVGALEMLAPGVYEVANLYLYSGGAVTG